MDERSDAALLETATATELLEALKDPANGTAWRQWVDRYRPLVVCFAERAGLARADAEDAAQNALLAFAIAYREGRYERSRGRLRAWLFGIARHQVLRRRAAVLGPRQEADSASLREIEASGGLESAWEEEWRAALLRQCLAVVRREFAAGTCEAFEQFVLQQRPARDVARELGLSENAVFSTKRRVLRRLRELEPLLEEVF